ncbi:MAG: YidC/Oxa1 family membrane protein insertase [Gudongella sp.]|jgi:YidC/Oxa1 family membrane protein insertase|nr:YidC/Oxa1 family membrane protein insertase [Gudongella sp.]
MIGFLGNLLGSILKAVYGFVSTTIGTEFSQISFYAIAIIITTIIFKLMLLPINLQQTRSTKKMGEIQPLMKEIQTKYKSDPQTMQVKMQELYKQHKYNPASGCLILLVQLPIIFAFFAVFREPAKYAFTEPGMYINMAKNFFWIQNLENPDIYLWGLPLLSAVTTYLQSLTMGQSNKDPQAMATQKMMNYMLPVMIFMAARSFPAGLALYWVVGNIFTIIQQVISNRSKLSIKGAK